MRAAVTIIVPVLAFILETPHATRLILKIMLSSAIMAWSMAMLATSTPTLLHNKRQPIVIISLLFLYLNFVESIGIRSHT